uniref:F-box domain-containing protein n=1 Tax=Florenciella sp. virus SA2 TaxID=3240092 RepID=A0AB39J6J7_9VIRU
MQKDVIIIPENVLIYILTFMNSFDFYKISKLLNLSLSSIYKTLISPLYSHYYCNSGINNIDDIKYYLLIDYFTDKRHLLFLNEWPEFKSYFFNNSWATNIYLRYHHLKHYIINIMRLTFFINVLRNVQFKETRKCPEEDKMVKTNIGVCFNLLIVDLQKKSEYETTLLKSYINKKRQLKQ